MSYESWMFYIVLVITACSSPGPAILFAVTTAINHGWKKALFAASGNIIGLFCLGTIAITGLGSLLDVSVLLYSIVKYLGAAYLIYMGIRLIVSKRAASLWNNATYRSDTVSRRKIFFQALTVAMSNPKAVVFLTALLPQFIVVEQPLFPQFIQLIGVLMFFSFLFLMGYALLIQKMKNWLQKPNSGQLFNRISGSIFIGFGLLLAASTKE